MLKGFLEWHTTSMNEVSLVLPESLDHAGKKHTVEHRFWHSIFDAGIKFSSSFPFLFYHSLQLI